MASALVLGLSACIPSPDASNGQATALTATVPGDVQPTVVVPAPEGEALAAVDGMSEIAGGLDVVFGTPVEVSLDGELPAEGATLSRTYAAPLPNDANPTFAYWNEEYGAWYATPTTLSADRRTATAIVHHFSLWNDFVLGTTAALTSVRDAAAQAGQKVGEVARNAGEWLGQAATNGANAIYWTAASYLSSRVELPECDQSTPNWVSDIPVSFAVEDSVRFCAGHDASNPDVLVLKARSNRGYGFPVNLAVDPVWEYNSTYEQNLATAIDTIGGVDSAIGESIAELFNSGRFVGSGEEISFGIPASALTGFASDFLLELPAPSMEQYMASTGARLIAGMGAAKSDGLVAFGIIFATCASGVNAAGGDAIRVSAAVLNCAYGNTDLIMKTYAAELARRGLEPSAAMKSAGKLLGQVTILFSGLGLLIDLTDYSADQAASRETRALRISLNPQALAPKPWLISGAGIGPATFDGPWSTVEPALGSHALRCDGSSQDWFVSVWGENPAHYIFLVAGGGEISAKVEGAPATAEGITLGSSESDLKALGYRVAPNAHTPYGSMYVLHDAGREIGVGVTPEGFVWAIDVGGAYLPAEFCN